MDQVIWGSPNWILPALFMAAMLLLAITYCYANRLSSGVRVAAAALKVMAVGALVLCLLDPLFSGTRPRPRANVFAVVIDNSCSMKIDKNGVPSTSEIMSWLGQESPAWKDRLVQDFDVRLYKFDHQLRQLDDDSSLDFTGLSSRVFSALESISLRFRQRPVAGVLLLTDGNATDDVRQMAPFGFPVYPVIVPKPVEPRDIRVTNVRVNQTNFESSPTTVHASIEVVGLQGENLVIDLRDPGGELVEQQSAEVTSGESYETTVRFRFRPEAGGLSFYSISAYAESEAKAFERAETSLEATLANNTRKILIDRGGGPFRILYVSGRPNWDFKFMRRALEDDDEIQLVGLQRIANKEPRFAFRDRAGVGDTNRLFEGFEDGDAEDAEEYDQPVFIRLGIEDEAELRDGFPKSGDELFSFHAILLDDLEASFFSPDQMLLIRRFVSQRGGGLMMLGGRGSFAQGHYARTPLGELLPVYVDPADATHLTGDYRIEFSREGWLEPWLRLRSTEEEESNRLESMPSFRTRNSIGNVKPGAVVVARVSNEDGQSAPAIITQRFGKGRSAALVLGDLWRWSMHRKTNESDDLATFWRQSMRWLTADVPRRVELEATQSADDSVVTLQCRVRDEEFKTYDGAQIQLTITAPDDETFEMTAEADEDQTGVYTARFWPKNDGGYLATADVVAADGSAIDTRKVGWTSQPAIHEFRRVRPDIKLLESIASESGGELVAPDSIGTFVTSLSSRKIPVTEPWVYPLWHQPWLFSIAVCCLCAEWGLRRWKGLA